MQGRMGPQLAKGGGDATVDDLFRRNLRDAAPHRPLVDASVPPATTSQIASVPYNSTAALLNTATEELAYFRGEISDNATGAILVASVWFLMVVLPFVFSLHHWIYYIHYDSRPKAVKALLFALGAGPDSKSRKAMARRSVYFFEAVTDEQRISINIADDLAHAIDTPSNAVRLRALPIAISRPVSTVSGIAPWNAPSNFARPRPALSTVTDRNSVATFASSFTRSHGIIIGIDLDDDSDEEPDAIGNKRSPRRGTSSQLAVPLNWDHRAFRSFHRDLQSSPTKSIQPPKPAYTHWPLSPGSDSGSSGNGPAASDSVVQSSLPPRVVEAILRSNRDSIFSKRQGVVSSSQFSNFSLSDPDVITAQAPIQSQLQQAKRPSTNYDIVWEPLPENNPDNLREEDWSTWARNRLSFFLSNDVSGSSNSNYYASENSTALEMSFRTNTGRSRSRNPDAVFHPSRIWSNDGTNISSISGMDHSNIVDKELDSKIASEILGANLDRPHQVDTELDPMNTLASLQDSLQDIQHPSKRNFDLGPSTSNLTLNKEWGTKHSEYPSASEIISTAAATDNSSDAVGFSASNDVCGPEVRKERVIKRSASDTTLSAENKLQSSHESQLHYHTHVSSSGSIDRFGSFPRSVAATVNSIERHHTSVSSLATATSLDGAQRSGSLRSEQVQKTVEQALAAARAVRSKTLGRYKNAGKLGLSSPSRAKPSPSSLDRYGSLGRNDHGPCDRSERINHDNTRDFATGSLTRRLNELFDQFAAEGVKGPQRPPLESVTFPRSRRQRDSMMPENASAIELTTDEMVSEEVKRHHEEQRQLLLMTESRPIAPPRPKTANSFGTNRVMKE